MSITSIDISALYITMFNRVPEGAGHKFWFNLAKKQGLNTSQVAQQMLNSAPAQDRGSSRMRPESREALMSRSLSSMP